MTAVDMTYEKELAPYQDFELPTTEKWQAVYREVQPLRMRILLLNGPAHSGKSHIAKVIKDMAGEQCVVVSMPETLYAMMGECGLPNCHLPYAEFKALPWGRRSLIDASNRIKRDDLAIICRFAMNKAQAKHPNCQLVVVDNLGFDYEVEWFKDHYTPAPILVQVAVPYALRHDKVAAEEYCFIYARKQRWPNDSRSALEPVSFSRVIAAVSSASMCRMLSEEDDVAEIGNEMLTQVIRWIRICANYQTYNPELPLGLVDLDSGAEPTTKD